MLSQYLDFTDEFNANGVIQFESSNYDYAIVQIHDNLAGDNINFKSTLDSGAIQGQTDGDISTSINYTFIVGENLNNNTFASNDGGAGGIFRFNVVGRYIRIESGGGYNVGKLLVMLAKIS